MAQGICDPGNTPRSACDPVSQEVAECMPGCVHTVFARIPKLFRSTSYHPWPRLQRLSVTQQHARSGARRADFFWNHFGAHTSTNVRFRDSARACKLLRRIQESSPVCTIQNSVHKTCGDIRDTGCLGSIRLERHVSRDHPKSVTSAAAAAAAVPRGNPRLVQVF